MPADREPVQDTGTPSEGTDTREALNAALDSLVAAVRDGAGDGSERVRSARRAALAASRSQDRGARDEAVRRVDWRRGCTVEYSSSPEAHRAEYDAEEAKILAERAASSQDTGGGEPVVLASAEKLAELERQRDALIRARQQDAATIQDLRAQLACVPSDMAKLVAAPSPSGDREREALTDDAIAEAWALASVGRAQIVGSGPGTGIASFDVVVLRSFLANLPASPSPTGGHAVTREPMEGERFDTTPWPSPTGGEPDARSVAESAVDALEGTGEGARLLERMLKRESVKVVVPETGAEFDVQAVYDEPDIEQPDRNVTIVHLDSPAAPTAGEGDAGPGVYDFLVARLLTAGRDMVPAGEVLEALESLGADVPTYDPEEWAEALRRYDAVMAAGEGDDARETPFTLALTKDIVGLPADTLGVTICSPIGRIEATVERIGAPGIPWIVGGEALHPSQCLRDAIDSALAAAPASSAREGSDDGDR